MQIGKSELWSKILENLEKEISSIGFNTWIKTASISSISGNHVVFEVTSDYHRDMLESKYKDLILNTLQFITNMNCTFSSVIKGKENQNALSDEKIISKKIANDEENEVNYSNSSLKPELNFDTFVVGENNRLAHAAALAVGEMPSSYNPLFIYGGVGLGKTHLLHAIGNKIQSNNRHTKILYVTSEYFTNQLVNAIKENKMQIFRNKYREVDVLLIDDIQFIAGKERVQEEFFHTFNTLKEHNKQIVLTSDLPPKKINFLEERLVSRFVGGLLADISNADYETRLAILRKKAQDDNVVIDDFILSDIAVKIDSNIRELEGVYQKIITIALLTQEPITIELAEKTINEFISEKEKKITSNYIQEVVAKYFNVKKEDLSGTKRSNDIAYPRQIAMFLCRDVADLSYEKIGEDFGGKDHSTVMYACKKIDKEIKTKENTKLIVESVKEILLNGQ